MTKYIVKKKGEKLVCDIDLDTKEGKCEYNKKVGEYGFKPVAKQDYDIEPLVKGSSKVRTIGEGEFEKKEDLMELHDFASYYLPQFIKVEQKKSSEE